MSFDTSWIGKTVGGGAFSIESWIAGSDSKGRLLGRDLRTKAEVSVGLTTTLQFSTREVRERLAYDIEGVAPVAFIGCADGEDETTGHAVLVEAISPMMRTTLTSQRARLSPQDCLQVAQQVAKTAARAASQDVMLAGFHPDLIGVDDALAVKLFPRFHVFASIRKEQRISGEPLPVLSDIGVFYDPAEAHPWFATSATDVYCFGLLLGWMFTGVHPFAQCRAYGSWLSSMAEDLRDPFTGPPAIGAILDRMLLADRSQRAPISEICAMLGALTPSDVTPA